MSILSLFLFEMKSVRAVLISAVVVNLSYRLEFRPQLPSAIHTIYANLRPVVIVGVNYSNKFVIIVELTAN